MSNKRSNDEMRGGGDEPQDQRDQQKDTGMSDGANAEPQQHEQEAGNKRARVQQETAAAPASVSSSVPATDSAAASSSSASIIPAAAPAAVSMVERRALFAQFRSCHDVNELQSIMARFLRTPLAVAELPQAWAPIFFSKLFDAPLPLSLQASILRVIASIHRTAGMGGDGLNVEQKGRFVDLAIAVLGRSSDPADLQAFARACMSASAPQLQTALPLLVVVLESDDTSAETLCSVMRVLIQAAYRMLSRPLLLQFGVMAALVRRCMPHPDEQVSWHALQLFKDLLFRAQEGQPFDDALVQSGILLEGRLAAHFSSADHKWLVMCILQLLENKHASEVQRVVLECLPQIICCLSTSSSHRINARELLASAVEEPTTPEQRAIILGAQTMQHMLRAFAPDEDVMSLELIRYMGPLESVLSWEQCAVASNVLHPIAEEFVQMRFVPCMEEMIQAPLEPGDDQVQLTRLVTMARFLAAHIYNRLPVGLASSQPHLGLTRQSSLTRRSCAAPQPQWFKARLEALEELLLREEMRLQQVEAAEQLNRAAAAADDGEDPAEEVVEPW